MGTKDVHLHPVEKAGALESSFRLRFQNPEKILGPYIKPGFTLLDLGCGPGYFTRVAASMLKGSGKVIAADIQTGMLELLRRKIAGTHLEQYIELHKSGEKSIGISNNLDFIIAFYAFHEMSCPDGIMDDICALLKPGGLIFIAEQKFHVRKSMFREIINKMERRGFVITERPSVFLSRAVVMRRG